MMCFLRVLVAALAASVVSGLEPTAYTASGKAIYTAPSGSRIQVDTANQESNINIRLYAPNGTLLHVFEDAGGSGGGGGGPLRRQSDSNGQVFASLGANNTLQSFNGTFVVPPPPTTFESQIMLFGSGYTTLDQTGAILLFAGVALQYGGSPDQGGPFYSGAAFAEFPGLGEYAIVTLPDSTEQLNVGDSVSVYMAFQGIVSVAGMDGPFYEYLTGFSGPNGDQLPNLQITQQVNPQIVGWRVELEGAEQPSDWPTAPLVFKDFTVELTTGFPSELDWEIEGGSAVDVDFEVVNGDPTNVEIKMTFPDAAS
ncbi:hypothetical protein HMN09_00289000 [Mycena chlorophos]|uniref:Uncharacterized protein n=1 Tax=Mycena chlorophos TaxID=658473 RepID=A0A8H6TL05_MYCCL|nr:hypothetical protein HMN09_00289000 [Mycena chlorophos]